MSKLLCRMRGGRWSWLIAPVVLFLALSAGQSLSTHLYGGVALARQRQQQPPPPQLPPGDIDPCGGDPCCGDYCCSNPSAPECGGGGSSSGNEMSSGDVPDYYFTGEDGTSCDTGGGDPCGGDPCCGDPCCGDPCCGDPCCGDPCCDDPYAPGCGEQCYEICETVCGDNETCLDEDPYTHWCYLWANDVCWDECHVECY